VRRRKKACAKNGDPQGVSETENASKFAPRGKRNCCAVKYLLRKRERIILTKKHTLFAQTCRDRRPLSEQTKDFAETLRPSVILSDGRSPSRTFAGRMSAMPTEQAKVRGAAEAGSIIKFCWLTEENVTLNMASQQNSLLDPCVTSLLGFGSARKRSAFCSPHQNFDSVGFASHRSG